MFGADKRFLSIAINETTIKVAQVKSSGTVEKVARAMSGTAKPADDQANALKTALNGFDRRAPVVCIVPAGAATCKNIEVPSTDPQEIKSIINLQASRHTPYSREEVLIGHINLGSTGNSTKILLVIAHRNAVKDRLAVLEKCGLSASKVLFVPEGIGRLYSKGLNLKKEIVGVIDFTLTSINFAVVSRGSSVFSRSIPIGTKALAEGGDAAAKVAEELTKSLAAYQGEDIDPAPASFVVTTENPAVTAVLPVLQQQLKGEVRLSPYVNFVKAGGTKSKLQGEFADDSFLDVIAPAAFYSKAEVNLMPQELSMKQELEEQGREAKKAGIAGVLIMLLVGAIIMSKIYFKDTFLNKNLREQYASNKAEVKSLEERMAKTKIVRDYLQGRTVSLDVIRELYRVTPPHIYLTTISFDEDGSISLAGVSGSMSQVFSYVKALDDSPMFVNPKTKSTSTKKGDDGKEAAAFEIVMKLSDGHKE